ncbi:hypothetical protein YPPY66_1772 [Yersinia pestis PY-66]|nr:hypothetical protein YpUG050454_2351 [Yersinia pestis biovar Antiqua str. UG05-0454]EIQ93449.1 hypothetical protein YPPY03_1635 [Yersinia pestis PY-03]EIR06068.1 hypothetical protein YPPY05_1567 [Yersinia pestis PY-05]EIR23011.1 hypothetical protein YPPY09_1617 [Yersinia pestis PY-09]EIR36228.1 hypothetical protein YPPY11_1683 [Yersinia pestis PY-11]EIR49853.1 hypothetical protein YPPY15_1571 [Yersinia pestis PY-15]EIR52110.1 hypothetical protein YPPY14_1566 [Yersinia pestis PY-14]EIR6370
MRLTYFTVHSLTVKMKLILVGAGSLSSCSRLLLRRTLNAACSAFTESTLSE